MSPFTLLQIGNNKNILICYFYKNKYMAKHTHYRFLLKTGMFSYTYFRVFPDRVYINIRKMLIYSIEYT